MDFTTAVRTVVLERYIDFNGRSSRPEYWWFALFSFCLSLVLSIIVYVIPFLTFVQTIIGLALLLPSIAVAIRRLHDLGKSGWWFLIAFTLIGIIPLIYWFCQPGTPASNDFGPPPVA